MDVLNLSVYLCLSVVLSLSTPIHTTDRMSPTSCLFSDLHCSTSFLAIQAIGEEDNIWIQGFRFLCALLFRLNTKPIQMDFSRHLDQGITDLQLSF